MRDLAGWLCFAAALGVGAAAWLAPQRPPDPYAALEWPVVLPEPPGARDARGPARSAVAVREAEARLVTDPVRAAAGYDLRIVAGSSEAALVDGSGRVVHRWAPDRDALGLRSASRPRAGALRSARLGEDGALYAVVEGVGLVALDRDGRRKWLRAPKAVGPIEVLPDGHVRVLLVAPRSFPGLSRTKLLGVEQLVEFDDGAEVGRFDLADSYDAAGVAWSPSAEGRPPFGAVGFATRDDGLVDVVLRERGTVAVVDPAGRLVREETGPWGRLGAAARRPDGGLTVVDLARGGVRLLELAVDGEVRTRRPLGLDRRSDPFAVQVLADGGTIVVGGDAQELDAAGGVVWAVSSPDDPPLALVQSRRYPPDCCTWLAE